MERKISQWQNLRVTCIHRWENGGVFMVVCAEKHNMQFYWMRKQHRYVLHLFRVSWNLYCGNVCKLILSRYSSLYNVFPSATYAKCLLKNSEDYLHSLLFPFSLYTSISTVIKNSLKLNFSLGNNFHIICIFTSPNRNFAFFPFSRS